MTSVERALLGALDLAASCRQCLQEFEAQDRDALLLQLTEHVIAVHRPAGYAGELAVLFTVVFELNGQNHVVDRRVVVGRLTGRERARLDGIDAFLATRRPLPLRPHMRPAEFEPIERRAA